MSSAGASSSSNTPAVADLLDQHFGSNVAEILSALRFMRLASLTIAKTEVPAIIQLVIGLLRASGGADPTSMAEVAALLTQISHQ